MVKLHRRLWLMVNVLTSNITIDIDFLYDLILDKKKECFVKLYIKWHYKIN